MGEDVLSGKLDWSSTSLESADKRECNEISGHRTHTPQSIITPSLLNDTQTAVTDPCVCYVCDFPTEDTLNFWKGIADVGLLGEVVTNISTELLELLRGVQQRRDAAALQDTGTQQVCSGLL